MRSNWAGAGVLAKASHGATVALPSAVERMTQSLGRRVGVPPGEVREVLERLPCGEVVGSDVPEIWQRPLALRALERYAARKRALARLAARGRL